MKKAVFILFFLFAAAYIAPLFYRPLLSPDETRYAEIAREMVASGNYVTPKLNGFRYFEKPVLGYWIFAGSIRLFGENAFAHRLPGALAAGLAAWLLFMLASKYCGGFWMGMLSATVYLATPMVFIMSSIGILDNFLCLFITAAMVIFFYATHNQFSRTEQIPFLFITGVLCGLAFLTKGFLAFAVPAVSIATYLLWQKRWSDFLILPWFPLLGAFIISIPWGLAIHKAEPDYWHYFFFVEHIQRFFGGESSAQHGEPFYFFLPILFGGAAIWTLLLPSIGTGLKSLSLKNPLLKFCLCWMVMPFLFFSASSGKLPPYILPCFAPMAILVAAGLHRSIIFRKKFLPLNMLSILLIVVLSIGLAGFAVNHFTGFPVALFYDNETWKWLIITIAGVLWGLMLLASFFEENAWWKLIFFMVGLVPVMIVSHFVLPDRVAARKAPITLIESAKAKVNPENTALASFRYPFQDVCWVFKRNDVWMFLEGGEIDEGLKYEDSKHRRLNVEEFNKLIVSEREKGRGILLVLGTKIYNEVKKQLPPPEWIESTDDGHPKGYSAIKF